MEIKLTDAERLILANQYAILGHLEDSKEYKRLAENLRNGYEYLYRDMLYWLNPEMDKETTEFVIDTLSMYRALKRSWEKLGKPDDIAERDIKWPGFDGNNEGKLYHFTRALAEANLFDELLGPSGVNAHAEYEETYRNMLPAWQALGDARQIMTAEQIKQVLAARGY